jgi:hypothetical protein
MVGNNPDAVATVRGANGGSRYAMPLRIKPERGQVAENSVKPPKSEGCDVLHDDVARSNLANEASVLAPQARPLSVNAGSGAGDTDVLAGEAAADDIDAIGEPFALEAPDVGKARDVRPVLSQDGSAIGLDLAEGDGPHSGPFEPEAEAADAGKEVEHIQITASGTGFGSRVF